MSGAEDLQGTVCNYVLLTYLNEAKYTRTDFVHVIYIYMYMYMYALLQSHRIMIQDGSARFMKQCTPIRVDAYSFKWQIPI